MWGDNMNHVDNQPLPPRFSEMTTDQQAQFLATLSREFPHHSITNLQQVIAAFNGNYDAIKAHLRRTSWPPQQGTPSPRFNLTPPIGRPYAASPTGASNTSSGLGYSASGPNSPYYQPPPGMPSHASLNHPYPSHSPVPQYMRMASMDSRYPGYLTPPPPSGHPNSGGKVFPPRPHSASPTPAPLTLDLRPSALATGDEVLDYVMTGARPNRPAPPPRTAPVLQNLGEQHDHLNALYKEMRRLLRVKVLLERDVRIRQFVANKRRTNPDFPTAADTHAADMEVNRLRLHVESLNPNTRIQHSVSYPTDLRYQQGDSRPPPHSAGPTPDNGRQPGGWPLSPGASGGFTGMPKPPDHEILSNPASDLPVERGPPQPPFHQASYPGPGVPGYGYPLDARRLPSDDGERRRVYSGVDGYTPGHRRNPSLPKVPEFESSQSGSASAGSEPVGGERPAPEWECRACTFRNNGMMVHCEMCETIRPND